MFEVFWLPSTREELLKIWLAVGPDGSEGVMAAANGITDHLGADPFFDTETRDGETRILLIWPLGIIFEVDLDEARVFIAKVWRIHRRPD